MGFHFNPHTVPFLLGILFALACGIFVLRHNAMAQLNRLFFYICLNIAMWFSMYIPPNFQMSNSLLILWNKIAYLSVIYLPVMCFTFVTTFINSPQNIIWYRINTTIALIFCILTLFTNETVSGIVYLPWYTFPSAGPLNILQIAHCIYLCFFMTKFAADAIRKEGLPQRKNQLKYLFIAMFFISLSALDYFAMYGVAIHPIASFTTIIFLSIVSLAIVKHRLMDIHVVIKKGLLYSFLISSITLLYVSIILVFERLFFPHYASPQAFIPSLLMACLIAVIFTPLRNKLQEAVDKLVFKNTALNIAQENQLLRQEIIQTERLKAVATLASGMAHEIKNPLTALKTFSEYLPQKAQDKQFIEKFVPIVRNEVDRIDKLVHELLDFARPAPVQLKPCNIYTLLDTTLEFLSSDFVKHRINVVKDYALDSSTLVNLDCNQFKQAILNILLNAIDALPQGGQITIAVTPHPAADRISLKIQDNGIGIAKENVPHIFEPFFSKKDSGTGLGLSITHEIVRNHKGRIFVESQQGKGTTFLIELLYAS